MRTEGNQMDLFNTLKQEMEETRLAFHHYVREHFHGHAVQIRQALRDKVGTGGV